MRRRTPLLLLGLAGSTLAGLTLAGLTLALAGCGKMGPPEPPKGVASTFPRQYPAPDPNRPAAAAATSAAPEAAPPAEGYGAFGIFTNNQLFK